MNPITNHAPANEADFVIENGVLKEYCGNETNVTIPDGVTEIGEEAFDGCSGLTSVTIPKGVKAIGEGAFDGCSSLTSVTIPEGVKAIEAWAFHGCSSLTSITIPEGVEAIKALAFHGCSSLTSITIPNSVIKIGTEIFLGCNNLKDVTLPEKFKDDFKDCFPKEATIHYTSETMRQKNTARPSIDDVIAKAESRAAKEASRERNALDKTPMVEHEMSH